MTPLPSTSQPAEELCVQQVFERRAAETPEAIAIRAGGRTLRYGELNAQANQLAHRLRHLGVQHGTIVAVCLDRSLAAIVAMLATLKAGGAYLPLDPRTPSARRGFMIQDSEALVLLTSGASDDTFGLPPERVLDLERDPAMAGESVENPASMTTGESLAYIIYTSGSTGQPKGVLVPHRGIVRLVRDVGYVRLDPAQTILWLAPISFDLATFEIWAPLLNGGRCVVYPNGALSLVELGEVLQREEVNTLWLISSVFNTVIDEAPHILSGVRQLLIGGEAMSPAHVVRAQSFLPATQISNGYGPTETTVVATCYAIPRDFPKTATFVPIGGPVGKTSLYILDAAMQPVAPGEIGELYIGGEGVGHGYLNLPALTAEKFLPNPFATTPGGKFFKTGDLAHWLPDGHVAFDGRADEQVKIRGFRIEPGEIQSAIEQHAAVERCAVLAADNGRGEKHLVAFVVPDRNDTTYAYATASLGQAQVSEWETFFDERVYGELAGDYDPAFNTKGWNSTYTGEPIPKEEMRAWLDDTVSRIAALQPKSLLEIGCGTGMLMFPLAPHCAEYFATDASQVALDYLRPLLAERACGHVRLLHGSGDDLAGLAAGQRFDGVILNSVVQYFPGIEYLLHVIEEAAKVIHPGGFIFLGDIRSLPLAEGLHAGVQLHAAPDELSVAALRQRVQRYLREEHELLVDPAFFLAVQQHLPRIGRVSIIPKRGRAYNELTRFRYQVVLHLDAAVPAAPVPQWIDWQPGQTSLAELRRLLLAEKPEVLGVARIPNARASAPEFLLQKLRDLEDSKTAGELRRALAAHADAGVDPEAIRALPLVGLPYTVELDWATHGAGGEFDAIFVRKDLAATSADPTFFARRPTTLPEQPWAAYGNNPLRDVEARQLTGELQDWLRQKLPDYMVPSAIVYLATLPVTANGKLDSEALLALLRETPATAPAVAAPAASAPGTGDPLEEKLCAIWQGVLGIPDIGPQHNFFAIGGHSLQIARIFAQIHQQFGKHIPIVKMFEQPTIAEFAVTLREALGESPKQKG